MSNLFISAGDVMESKMGFMLGPEYGGPCTSSAGIVDMCRRHGAVVDAADVVLLLVVVVWAFGRVKEETCQKNTLKKIKKKKEKKRYHRIRR
jgi:hypothetical protein